MTVSFLEIHKWQPDIYIGFSLAIHLQWGIDNCSQLSSPLLEQPGQEALLQYKLHTVTRLDVIFRYPDRVPLTHFVHRAKKAFAMRAWIFCWVLCATGIFRRCNGKVIEHRVGANLWPSDYGPSVLPLRHCSLVWKIQGHSFSSFAGILRPFL